MSTSVFQIRSGAVCHACWALALVLIGVLGSGCAYGELRQVLRAEVASEADCGEITVVKTSPYAPGYVEGQYLVRGCGVDRIYTCKEDGLVAFGHANCTYAAGATANKPAAPAAPPPGVDSSDPALQPLPPASDSDSNQPDDL
jgi:hypothetical protein